MKRRNFLKIFPTASVTPFVVNGIPMRAFANTTMGAILGDCKDVEDRALVLIQLKGGNDGINTIIPLYQYDKYMELRPIIGVPDKGEFKYINLDSALIGANQVGLHPTLTGFKELYEKGWMNIIQAVGYENLNGSHFKSTDIWLSGGDGTKEGYNIRSGWMGRALNAMYPNIKGEPTPEMKFPLGIQIGDFNPSLGFHTETEHRNSINLSGLDPDGFYSLVQTIGGAPVDPVPDSEYGTELKYIMGVEKAVDRYSEHISAAFKAGSNSLTYPQYGLANQLKTVARLIKGGCKTKIYLVSMGGYDTHGSQIEPEGNIVDNGHGGLLRHLSESVKFFFNDLNGLGLGEKVMACTFSEFGRCAKENGSAGTDHGTLAPMFIFGKGAKPGVNGTSVDLKNLTKDNQLQGQQYDYRQVFTTILQDWLGASNYVLEQTMFEGFVKMPLIAPTFTVSPDCYIGSVTSVWDDTPEQPVMRLSPNPAVTRSEVMFRSDRSFEARLSLHSLGGALVSSNNVSIQAGTNYYYLELRQLPAGIYFVRMEDKLSGKAEVAKLNVFKN
jgi:uncharacterized protein (DUF1501 family)